jgi:sulfoxide reductase heme-binding subunit YedZ
MSKSSNSDKKWSDKRAGMKTWKYTWMIVTLLALLPLLPIVGLMEIEFDGLLPVIRMESLTLPSHDGGIARQVSGVNLGLHTTGEWAIRWLVVVLSCTPVCILTGIKSRITTRQAMGITAFVYGALHYLFFLIQRGLPETFVEVNFILGLIAVFIMLPLALTSNRKALRFMRKKWKKLHRLAYFAGSLAVLHVAILGKGDWIPYAIILGIGFILRIPSVKENITTFRKSISSGRMIRRATL